MATYKDEAVAGSMKSVVGRLGAVKDHLAQDGVYQRSCGLTTELLNSVLNYSAAGPKTNLQTQLVTAEAERAVIAKAVASAIDALNTQIDALEI